MCDPYSYDLAGNRTQKVDPSGTVNYHYDAANRLSYDDTYTYLYDNNGNLTTKKQGSTVIDSYGWDRANRLISFAGTAYQYAYDGEGRRVQQTVGGTVTQYLLDVAQGLWKVVAATTGANTTRYVHDQRGIISQQNLDSSQHWPLPDGLGNVRTLVNNSLAPQESKVYWPYGEAQWTSGDNANPQTVFGFTGEPTDANKLVQLRARYLNPMLGVFTGLDSLEGAMQQPMSLNRYSYTQGNAMNNIDPSGMISCPWGFEPHGDKCVPINVITGPLNLVGSHQNLLHCPLGSWDCESVRNIFALKDDFLDSASRHNKIPSMSDLDFASLIASVIVGETHIGNIPDDKRNLRNLQIKEDLAASVGAVLSGDIIKPAYTSGDYLQVLKYLLNQDVPSGNPIYVYASVGIGNIKLPTAETLWRGRFCNWEGKNCVNARVSPLKVKNSFGWTIPVENPFPFDATTCTSGGACSITENEQIAAYSFLARQLVSYDINIEYVAAILEAGALRIQQLGELPTVINSVTWYIRSAQTDAEITDLIKSGYPDPRGHATGWVIPSMQVARQVLTA